MGFDDVRKVMEMHGWVMRPAGEHTAVFTKPGERRHLSVPTVKGRNVKRYILVQICELLGLDDSDD